MIRPFKFKPNPPAGEAAHSILRSVNPSISLNPCHASATALGGFALAAFAQTLQDHNFTQPVS
jgi:hypothetical protein